jgi:hypothetical protein
VKTVDEVERQRHHDDGYDQNQMPYAHG